MLVNLIKRFCDVNTEYTYYEGSLNGRIPDEKYIGIVLKEQHSYMELMMKLTQFLTAEGFEDENGELLGAEIDSLGTDMILYFPFISTAVTENESGE